MKKGFTLIELIVAVFIISIISAIIVSVLFCGDKEVCENKTNQKIEYRN